jgi:hypothetical protein
MAGRTRNVFIVGLMVLGALGTGALPSRAASGATCAAEAGVTLKPGISQTPTTGTFASKPGGVIACVGQINGVNVGGKGTLSFSGTYGSGGGDTCSKGAGAGKISATVPKVGGGSLRVSGSFTFTRAGSDVVVRGKVSGGTLAGDLQFLPAPGQTCFTVKVTSATVAGGAAVGSP